MKKLTYDFSNLTKYEMDKVNLNDLQELSQHIHHKMHGTNGGFIWRNDRVIIYYDVEYSNVTNIMNIILKDISKKINLKSRFTVIL